jgi:hypothetical protein
MGQGAARDARTLTAIRSSRAALGIDLCGSRLGTGSPCREDRRPGDTGRFTHENCIRPYCTLNLCSQVSPCMNARSSRMHWEDRINKCAGDGLSA